MADRIYVVCSNQSCGFSSQGSVVTVSGCPYCGSTTIGSCPHCDEVLRYKGQLFCHRCHEPIKQIAADSETEGSHT
jgi:predicted amidophosphoribosyltransferase